MTRQYSYFKTQTPTSESDYTETITKGQELVDEGTIVTKLTICAETNLKLLITNGNVIIPIYLKEGTSWSVDNDDTYRFTSIVCDSNSAKCTYMLGYYIK